MVLCFGLLFYFHERGEDMDFKEFMVDSKEGIDLCRLAILLAMSTTPEMERLLVEQYKEMGIRSGVTMISGFGISSQSHIIKSVINLCLNTNVISRKKEHIHPVAHCVLETTQSTRASDAIGQNFRFKVAVVRKGSHFALCFYGDLAMHELSGHKTVGVGFQILGE